MVTVSMLMIKSNRMAMANKRTIKNKKITPAIRMQTMTPGDSAYQAGVRLAFRAYSKRE
ncbi:hypothetical protein [Paenibacillus taihuensis]|uniref:hypothetical protein n=1 Tax=Paenibacillus taihuensis TaxID=1156355 RepID=UPI003CCC6317